MSRNYPNFRRDIKNLWKAFQRRTITEEGINDWFRERGFFGAYWNIQDILRTKVPSRIFSRIGRAALKQDKLVFISAILGKTKMTQVGSGYIREFEPVKDYRTIPFYRPAVKETTSIKVELGWLDDNGNFTEVYQQLL